MSCTHAAYKLLQEGSFASLGHLRTLAVLTSSLATDVASVGMEDAEACKARHPLALRYAFSRPQRQAALATVLEVAHMTEGADIFAKLSGAEAETLRGERGWDGEEAWQGGHAVWVHRRSRTVVGPSPGTWRRPSKRRAQDTSSGACSAATRRPSRGSSDSSWWRGARSRCGRRKPGSRWTRNAKTRTGSRNRGQQTSWLTCRWRW